MYGIAVAQLGQTWGVKTAISVPDDTFEAVRRWAQQLGMSHSEFFSIAAHRFLDELNRHSITGQVDAALRSADDDGSAVAAVVSGRRRLSSGNEF